jgi:hypothetical protein
MDVPGHHFTTLASMLWLFSKVGSFCIRKDEFRVIRNNGNDHREYFYQIILYVSMNMNVAKPARVAQLRTFELLRVHIAFRDIESQSRVRMTIRITWALFQFTSRWGHLSERFWFWFWIKNIEIRSALWVGRKRKWDLNWDCNLVKRLSSAGQNFTAIAALMIIHRTRLTRTRLLFRSTNGFHTFFVCAELALQSGI